MTACAFHFGATVPWEEFPRIADRLRARGADSAIGNPIGLEAFHDPAEVIAQ